MIKKLFLVVFVIGAALTNKTIKSSCCLDAPKDQVCYLGALDFKLKNAEAQQLTLCYDGTMITVNDGIYCFKESKDIEKFYALFMDPEAIRSIKKNAEGNTIGHLSFTPQTSYHLYRFKRTQTNDETYDWHIKRKPMPKKEIKGHLVALIPDHTLIIPVDSQFFQKTEHNSILFTYKSLKNNDNVIKLPFPVASGQDKEQLQEALLKAKFCMIHLKNIHAKQETKEIYLDKHRLIQ